MTAPVRANLTFTGRITPTVVQSTTRTLTGRVIIAGRNIRAATTQTSTRTLRGSVQFTGAIVVLKKIAYGAFKDFAHYADTMPDPAKVLFAGSLSGVAYDAASVGNMRRVWATVSPPREYVASGGQVLWKRAAFVATGVRVNAMPTTTWQFVDGAQVELTPSASTGPTAYVPARALSIVVKANAMNYVKNPLTGFTLTAGTNSTRAMTGVVGKYYAGFVKVTSAPVGSTVRAVVEDSSGVVADSGVQTVSRTGVFPRVVMRATQPTVSTALTLRVYAISSTGTVNIALPRVDRVTGIGGLPDADFISGDLGTDYLWGGASNNSESYYYRDRATRTYLLQRVLEENSPLGVIPGAPQFAVLPTE